VIDEVMEKRIGTKIIGEHIVCREDHGDMRTPESYKKSVRSFIPVDENMCFIVDDTPEIWVNMVEVYRVPKYLFWPNPEVNYPGTTNTRTQNKMNKNSSPSQWTVESLLKQNNDNMLLQLMHTCKAVHYSYFDRLVPISVGQILNQIRKTVLQNCHILFTGMFPSKMDATKDRHWRFAIEFGILFKVDILFFMYAHSPPVF